MKMLEVANSIDLLPIPQPQCPECHNNLIENCGSVTCSTCGLIISEENKFVSLEPPCYRPEQYNRLQHGAPASEALANNLTTKIAWTDVNHIGNPNQRTMFLRLQKFHRAGLNYSERALQAGLGKVLQLCNALEL